jgi:hypothetical protein
VTVPVLLLVAVLTVAAVLANDVDGGPATIVVARAEGK